MPDSPPVCDVLVIGAGAAGLTAALHLADTARITVLAKGPLTEGSTRYAQGGISAVIGAGDSIEHHSRDTMEAGAGLCDSKTVRYTVERSREAVEWLIDQGVPFTRANGSDASGPYHLTREGGHSHRRVLHVADATGRAVSDTLLARAEAHPNITLLEHQLALDLITGVRVDRPELGCLGAYVLDSRPGGTIRALPARAVILATGGASKAYLYTSNPDTSTGDGIAMAWRAGCRVANMEFMQFHPTCLYHPRAKSFLISEALRGEGALLRLPDGTRFMPRFHEQAELAPRDIVARAIDHEMKRLGVDHVLLDITHKPASFILEHFPTIHASCRQFGIDITRDPIPVVPAAHYTCGGVMTDAHARTDLPWLYVAGESAYTGLHGANRMASNSLLECLVFGRAAAQDLATRLAERPPPLELPPWDESRVTDSDEEVVVSHNWHELRQFMWDYVGIVRTTKRLHRAMNRLELLKDEIREYYSNFRVTGDLLELRNLVTAGDLIVRSALSRHESRGLHYTLDYPTPDPAQRHPTILDPKQRP